MSVHSHVQQLRGRRVRDLRLNGLQSGAGVFQAKHTSRPPRLTPLGPKYKSGRFLGSPAVYLCHRWSRIVGSSTAQQQGFQAAGRAWAWHAQHSELVCHALMHIILITDCQCCLQRHAPEDVWACDLLHQDTGNTQHGPPCVLQLALAVPAGICDKLETGRDGKSMHHGLLCRCTCSPSGTSQLVGLV